MQALRKAIAEGNCVLNLDEWNMEGILREAATFLVQTGKLTEEQASDVIDGLIERERVAPTAIGHACAIPHYYGPVLDEPLMLFVRLRHAANLGAPDGVATRFIFLLIGPEKSAAKHLDTLAAIARLMADDDFHFEATGARSQRDLLDALDEHVRRSRPSVPAKPSAPREELTGGAWPLEGLMGDIRRRAPHYLNDFREGLQAKCLSSIFFLFFACLAPAVTFGGIMGLATNGEIGPVEMLTASAVCGVMYALFAGQPLIILGGIGPLLIFTIILYRLCGDLGYGDQFLSVYAWVGLWTGLFTTLLAITNASNLMRYFTRFTDEIFSALMSLIFIFEAVKALVITFQESFREANEPHDEAFLTLLLAVGTFYIAVAERGSAGNALRQRGICSTEYGGFMGDSRVNPLGGGGPGISRDVVSLLVAKYYGAPRKQCRKPTEEGRRISPRSIGRWSADCCLLAVRLSMACGRHREVASPRAGAI